MGQELVLIAWLAAYYFGGEEFSHMDMNSIGPHNRWWQVLLINVDVAWTTPLKSEHTSEREKNQTYDMEFLSENNTLRDSLSIFLSSTSTSYFKTLNKALPKISPQNALQKKGIL